MHVCTTYGAIVSNEARVGAESGQVIFPPSKEKRSEYLQLLAASVQIIHKRLLVVVEFVFISVLFSLAAQTGRARIETIKVAKRTVIIIIIYTFIEIEKNGYNNYEHNELLQLVC